MSTTLKFERTSVTTLRADVSPTALLFVNGSRRAGYCVVLDVFDQEAPEGFDLAELTPRRRESPEVSWSSAAAAKAWLKSDDGSAWLEEQLRG